MLDPKYRVIDKSWQQYPSAVSVQQLIQAKKGLKFESEYEIDSLIVQVLLSMDKDFNRLIHLNPGDTQFLSKMVKQATGVLDCLEKSSNLTFELALKEERLWLLDNLDQKLLSGFFHNLLIDPENQIGVIINHYFEKSSPPPIKENKELQTLALIAAEAFNLKGIAVVSLWVFSEEPQFHSYTLDSLFSFKEELRQLLKQIH